MVSFEPNAFPQDPTFLLDGLYCEEDRFDVDLGSEDFGYQEEELCENCLPPLDNGCLWEDEDDELLFLLSKEKGTVLCEGDLICNRSVIVARKEGIDWMMKVSAHYGFVGMTRVLAVNYFDRFLSSPCFQRDKPWMSQLAAVACISLAAKVEETQVPILLDLQVEETKFVFESKTIMRMELLVLSALQWKMNPVTPLSFFDHVVRRVGFKINHLRLDFVNYLLSTITDSRSVFFLPSVMAIAILCLVVEEVVPCNGLEYQNQLKVIPGISKESVGDCYKFIKEVSHSHRDGQAQNRKPQPIPASPSGIIDACFSSESSNESWAVASSVSSSVSSSPEPLLRKRRAQDQQMRLAPLNRLC